MSPHSATSRPRLWAAVASVAALLALAGCSGAPAGLPDREPSAVTGGAPADSGDRSKTQVDQAPAEGPLVPKPAQVVRTGSLTLTVKDPVVAAAQLRIVAEAAGGYVAAENVVTDSKRTGISSMVVLSVPSDRLDAVLDEAAKVGVLKSRQVTASDVTTQVVDIEARITTMRESVNRVRALMQRAGTLTEIAMIESELTQRQSELESLLAQQKALKTQVERAPITITLMVEDQVVVEPENPFLAGLNAGWQALLKSTAVLVTVLGAVFPFALVGALIVWPLVWWRRRRVVRVSAPAQAAPAPASTGTTTAPGTDPQA